MVEPAAKDSMREYLEMSNAGQRFWTMPHPSCGLRMFPQSPDYPIAQLPDHVRVDILPNYRVDSTIMTDRLELLQGTLDMLILRTLRFGPAHGHQIARHIQRTSEDLLQVEHGSLYPALHRLERKGLIAARWQSAAEGKREFKYYRLTAAGKKHSGAGGVQVETTGRRHRAHHVAGRGG